MAWQRSTYCNTGACVEAAPTADGSVAVRDSKNPGAPVLVFTKTDWNTFLDEVAADARS